MRLPTGQATVRSIQGPNIESQLANVFVRLFAAAMSLTVVAYDNRITQPLGQLANPSS
jgi:hypothetical protein